MKEASNELPLTHWRLIHPRKQQWPTFNSLKKHAPRAHSTNINSDWSHMSASNWNSARLLFSIWPLCIISGPWWPVLCRSIAARPQWHCSAVSVTDMSLCWTSQLFGSHLCRSLMNCDTCGTCFGITDVGVDGYVMVPGRCMAPPGSSLCGSVSMHGPQLENVCIGDICVSGGIDISSLGWYVGCSGALWLECSDDDINDDMSSEVVWLCCTLLYGGGTNPDDGPLEQWGDWAVSDPPSMADTLIRFSRLISGLMSGGVESMARRSTLDRSAMVGVSWWGVCIPPRPESHGRCSYNWWCCCCRRTCCRRARSRLYIGPNLLRPPRILSARTAETVTGKDSRLPHICSHIKGTLQSLRSSQYFSYIYTIDCV